MKHVVSYDPRAADRRSANQWRHLAEAPKPTLREKAYAAVMYGVVAVGVGVAVFYVTPAHSAGSMASDVRIIRVSPSVSVYGNDKAADSRRLETLKQQGRMDLENQRSANERALAADKAYYEKLKDQRKRK